ncbi:hypothetical protein ACFL0Y_04095 [Patescibacteria group bacterium]
MAEDKNIQTEGSFSDKAIGWAIEFDRKWPPDHFHRRLNPDPEDDLKQIEEQDLPVVKEARDITEQARENGRLASSERNPFGEIDELLMFVVGDLHFSGSNPEKAIENRSPVYQKIQAIGFQTIRQRLKGKNWPLEVKPIKRLQGYYSVMNAVLKALPQQLPSKPKDSSRNKMAIAIFDMGDRSNTEACMGDIALTAIEYEVFRRKAEEISAEASGEDQEANIFMAMLKGTHDGDVYSRGITGEKFERDLYGSQIFSQEVGDDNLVLALNTNYASRIWLKIYEREKKKVKDSEGDLKKTVGQIEKDMALQKELIQEALKSGKKIILMGHEEALLKQIIPLENSRVTHIICGHLHTAKIDSIGVRNSDGETIQRVRVGAAIGGGYGFEPLRDPVGHSVVITDKKVEANSLEIPKHDKDYPFIASPESG